MLMLIGITQFQQLALWIMISHHLSGDDLCFARCLSAYPVWQLVSSEVRGLFEPPVAQWFCNFSFSLAPVLASLTPLVECEFSFGTFFSVSPLRGICIFLQLAFVVRQIWGVPPPSSVVFGASSDFRFFSSFFFSEHYSDVIVMMSTDCLFIFLIFSVKVY